MTGNFSSLPGISRSPRVLSAPEASTYTWVQGTGNVPTALFLVCSLAFFFVGLFVFRAFEKDGVKRGTLGAY